MKTGCTILILCFCSIRSFSQPVRIGLFNDQNLQTLVISAVKGDYDLIADNKVIKHCINGQIVYIKLSEDSLKILSIDQSLGLFSKITFKSSSDSSIFSVKPVFPSISQRLYQNDLYISVVWKRIQLINLIDLDKYIAGVVQSEGGPKATLEYYKTQAVLCRTYAISNFIRHTDEGFNLCDGVHCQAYFSMADKNPLIPDAALATKGVVIVDSSNMLITAAFHSNCGGQTENSERVWLLYKPYLRSVSDPYCQNQHNSYWEKTITLGAWKDYLVKQGFSGDLNYEPSYFNFIQYERKLYYKLRTDSVELKKIRTDFKLKSTFFSIQADGGSLVFRGRGYGHGVGLCQEGAMQMSRLGYSYSEIINFYYKNIRIADFNSIPGLKMP